MIFHNGVVEVVTETIIRMSCFLIVDFVADMLELGF